MHVRMVGSMRRQEPAQIEALADVLLTAALGGASTVSTSSLSSEVRPLVSELLRALGLQEVNDFNDDAREIAAVVWIMSTAHAHAAPFITARWHAPVVMVTPDGSVDIEHVEVDHA